MTAGLGNLWRDSAAEQFSTSQFQGNRNADLAIIGGGFTGLSAALHASGQGADVTLLEAETIGHGGSGRNVGLVNAGLWLPPEEVCKALGEHPGEHLNRVLAAAPDLVFDLIGRHAIACEPVRAGTLHLAHAPSGLGQLQMRLAQMQARGAPVRLLEAQEVATRLGSERFHGALHDPRAGTIQPLAYARGLARAATSAGARLHEHSAVTSAERRGGQWLITTRGGKLQVRKLLIATNAYHQSVSHLDLPKVPMVQYFQIATAPLGDNLAGDILSGGEGAWDTGLIMTSIRRDQAGRVILGGMGGDARQHTDWAVRKLAQLFPRLRGATIEHAWSGRISMPANHLPRIQRVAQGAYAIYGYSGRGIGPGTVFGKAVAEALLQETEAGLPVPAIATHHERLVALKTLYYETGARLVHLSAARR